VSATFGATADEADEVTTTAEAAEAAPTQVADVAGPDSHLADAEHPARHVDGGSLSEAEEA
jgi:hypothetical protein